MVITMAGQLKQLVIMAVFGFCAAFLYDILRASRRVARQSTFCVSVQDILFWVLCAVCTMLLVFRINYGEMRAFMFFGITVGAMVYYAVISPVFLKISMVAANTAAAFLKLAAYPFACVIRVVKPKFKYFVNFVKKYLNFYIKYGKIKSGSICKSVGIIFKKH